jgi:hypothetical protein
MATPAADIASKSRRENMLITPEIVGSLPHRDRARGSQPNFGPLAQLPQKALRFPERTMFPQSATVALLRTCAIKKCAVRFEKTIPPQRFLTGARTITSSDIRDDQEIGSPLP